MLGEWLEINGEAIYDTSPWYYQSDASNEYVWYTCKKKAFDPSKLADVPTRNDIILTVYAIFLKWPNNDKLIVSDLNKYMRNYNFTVNILNGETYIPVNVSDQHTG